VTTPADRRRLATTRWSLVLAAADPSAPEARAALATLCETYWLPVFDFIRYTGRQTEESRELTQAFFARVLERGDLRNARQERGRFRSFLLTAVRHLLANQTEYDRAQKRGGGQVHLTIGPADPGDPTGPVEPQSQETPETIYEHRWALTTLETAMIRLAREYESSGRNRLFSELKAFLAGEEEASYARAAGALDMSEGAVRVAVHRLRKHFGQCLRATLAETVDSPDDIDGELQYLLGVINRRRPAGSL